MGGMRRPGVLTAPAVPAIAAVTPPLTRPRSSVPLLRGHNRFPRAHPRAATRTLAAFFGVKAAADVSMSWNRRPPLRSAGSRWSRPFAPQLGPRGWWPFSPRHRISVVEPREQDWNAQKRRRVEKGPHGPWTVLFMSGALQDSFARFTRTTVDVILGATFHLHCPDP